MYSSGSLLNVQHPNSALYDVLESVFPDDNNVNSIPEDGVEYEKYFGSSDNG